MEFCNFEVLENEEDNTVKYIFRKCFDCNLHKTLLDITDDEQFYNDEVTKTPQYFLQHLPVIKSKVENGTECLLSLVIELNERFKDKINQYEQMKDDGKITFDHLSRLFPIGARFVAKTSENQLVGSIVHKTTIETGPMGEKYLIVTGMFTFSNGLGFLQKEKQFVIQEFKGLRYVDSLSIRTMTEEDLEFLTNRGKKFLKYGLNVHYCAYNGTMFYNTMWGAVHFNATGRLMVDRVGYTSCNPNDREFANRHHKSFGSTNNNNLFTEIPDDLLYLTWPFMKGFSFVAKRWGDLFVEKLEDIEFDDNSFDYLVLDERKKHITKSLILNSKKSFTDVISGKSGGCIFLLHGPPGTGKTLTCEAISELLHQPLYSITVGELGTTPDTLEQKLTQILEMTKSWNASILIDEADIFLEKRTSNDIQRNAMVGIFLRLLERHTGVMFLTTNRESSFDEAFRSRISVIFEYPELDVEKRALIWKNLLNASNTSLSDVNIEKLANEHKINGRQIKNAIRMGQALSISDNETLTDTHLNEVISMM